jgi:hypothetical protein
VYPQQYNLLYETHEELTSGPVIKGIETIE